MKAYDDALSYLYRLEQFGTVFGLDAITRLLGLFGNPHTSLNIVHIAGTNGKGSVCAMIDSILQKAGYRVGRYTSPHLVSFTERIAVNGNCISEQEVVDLTGRIRRLAEESTKDRFFTFFDFTTAMALLYFSEQNVDIAVLEVGLGGRLDSTNIVTPVVSVITNVEKDHTEWLGKRKTQIAAEKAGIIKPSIPVVTGVKGPALNIIQEVARKQKSSLFVLGSDFSYRKKTDQTMAYRGINAYLPAVETGLAGDHQLKNAAIALCTMEVLSRSTLPVDNDALLSGLKHVSWPGRLEVVRNRPLIILDGAHNPHGIRHLSIHVKKQYKGLRKTILIFGVMKDKEYETMLRTITPGFDVVILTKPDVERALSPDIMKCFTNEPRISHNIRDALIEAQRISNPEDLVLITGSLFTVGEAKQLIDELF